MRSALQKRFINAVSYILLYFSIFLLARILGGIFIAGLTFRPCLLIKISSFRAINTNFTQKPHWQKNTRILRERSGLNMRKLGVFYSTLFFNVKKVPP